MLKKLHVLLSVPVAILAVSAQAETQCSLLSGQDAGKDDTSLIQNSIDACSKNGGGVLKLQARTYEIAPIQLKNDVYLWLDAKTVLKATTDKMKFVPAFIGWPYNEHEALISAAHVHNAGLRGSGTIDGTGEIWWKEALEQRKNGTMAHVYPSIPLSNGMPRPWLVEFYESSNVSIDGVKLTNSPMWVLALRYSKGVKVSNLTVRNPEKSANTDGIDVVSSKDVTIEKVDISTGDDCIAIKSGLAGSDLPTNPTSNIVIRDAELGNGHGLSIGSETRNGVNHVTMENIRFNGTGNGIRIKTGRDRGADISFITAKNVKMDNVNMAFSVSAYYPKVPAQHEAPQPITPTTPFIHDVTVENLVATHVKSAGQFIGLPESPLKNFQLSNIDIQAQKGLVIRDATLAAHDLNIKVAEGQAIQVKENAILKQ